jgi:histidine triad (HIT) family protein
MSEGDVPLIASMVFFAKRLAEEQGIAESGYKLVINNGRDGGQIIEHVHLHLLGGEPLTGIV